MIARDLERPQTVDNWIALVRAAIVPFVFLEVLTERGNYPPGDEAFAWAIAGVFTAGTVLLFARTRLRAPALAFDAVVVSSIVALYSFEAGTPVRQVLFIPVVEAALRYGLRGGALVPLASLPALAFFEWRQAIDLDFHPFDIGHVLGPAGLQLFVGLAVGALVSRLRQVTAD